MLTHDDLRRALCKAWALGQTYWQQADSESYRQNAKADETKRKFEELVETTVGMLNAPDTANGGKNAD